MVALHQFRKLATLISWIRFESLCFRPFAFEKIIDCAGSSVDRTSVS